MRSILLYLFVLFSILLGFYQDSHALSFVPKDILNDVSASGRILPGGYYRDGRQMNVIGKNADNTSLAWEYSNTRYGLVQWGEWHDYGYEGYNNYMVLNIFANGIGGIGSYPAIPMSLLVDDVRLNIGLPAFSFTGQADVLSLYVADSGSTFWGHYTNGPYHTNTNEGITFGEVLDNSLTLSPSQAFTIEHFAATGGTRPVPEPATMLLLGSGLIGLAGFRRKFRKG